MKYLAILRFLRRGDVLALAVSAIIGAGSAEYLFILVRQLLELPVPSMDWSPGVILGAAYFGGLALATRLRRIQDCPLVWLLPDSRRLFGIWHGMAGLIFAGALCWVWSRWVHAAAELPFPVSFGWALFGLSLNAPLDRRPTEREFWLGLALGGGAVLAVADTFGPELAAASRAYPAAALLVGLAAAGWNGWAWQRRERTRVLAALRFGLPTVAHGVELTAATSAGMMSLGRSLTRKGSGIFGFSLWHNLGMILMISPLLLLASLVLGPGKESPAPHPAGLASISACIYIVAEIDRIVPRTCREPISRRMRLETARRSFWLLCFLAVIATMVFQLADEVGWALRHGSPYEVDLRAPLWAGLIAAASLPLIVWLRLAIRIRRGASSFFRRMGMTVLWCVAFNLAEELWVPHAAGGRWLACGLVGIGAAAGLCGLCELSLRGFFLRGDLPVGSGPA